MFGSADTLAKDQTSISAESGLQEAAALLRRGFLIAFPTETVYGLGADASNDKAVARIFEAKGRPADNPLIVHIAEREQMAQLTESCSDLEAELMGAFWPGPLTLVLPVRPGALSPLVTAGLDTVAVRMPDHPVALRLIAAAGCPVAAPSANRSGRPSPTRADHVAEDLGGRIDGLVDGGPTGIGLESTVIQVVDGRIVILRPGGVTAEALSRFAEVSRTPDRRAPQLPVTGSSDGSAPQRPATGSADVTAGGLAVPQRETASSAAVEPEAPRSPGMKYAHYAPRGEMQLVQGAAVRMQEYIQSAIDAARARGTVTGVLTYAEHAADYRADVVLAIGSLVELETAAQGLYAALREMDSSGVERIWAEACPAGGIGDALMNRLVKAAGHRVVEV
ncbi:L-threonylcarbamoyladenylate synthase [Paenibacillus sp. 1P07SE]|uniref:L-threonylcarbamoyladenylate synthase n=1 Tax=Paenibacillus sp. 1P07SE TaxID=3132209 RepID=UPI0039A68735